jgi:hypothetical protein
MSSGTVFGWGQRRDEAPRSVASGGVDAEACCQDAIGEGPRNTRPPARARVFGREPSPEVLGETGRHFVDCLPIVAAQYLMSLRFANFLAPIGIGLLAWVGALAVLSWQHANLVPYAYTMLDYLGDNPAARTTAPTSGLQLFALAWFVLLTVAGYVLFATRTHKG